MLKASEYWTGLDSTRKSMQRIVGRDDAFRLDRWASFKEAEPVHRNVSSIMLLQQNEPENKKSLINFINFIKVWSLKRGC